MRPYLIFARMPRNPSRYLATFKRELLDFCAGNGIECVIEPLGGRILVFTSRDICDRIVRIRGVLDCRSVEIFHDPESLVKKVLPSLENCRSFAVRCNRMHVAQEIGAMIHEALGIPANLENPDCEVRVEFRNDLYILL